VLEKSEVLRAEGAGIGVQANGWRALEQLGVAADLRKTAGLITAYVSSLTVLFYIPDALLSENEQAAA
jgi:2-polyprenyl-6-methoxyphenol hydroxylase-like FAD-dependent oxidoreductase